VHLREVFGEITPNADAYDIALDLSEKIEMKDRLNNARALIIDDGERCGLLSFSDRLTSR
jgi:hypothetical protein